MAETVTYTLGGTVQAGGGVYIPRQADAELLKLCQDAIFAYVLTPRQMGKSSLMVWTAETLVNLGIRSVIVDLQELGGKVTAEQWYFGFLVKLDDQLMFDTDVVSWWREHEHLGVSQRLTQFFEQVLLAEVLEKVVVFVDEIDSTLSLDFTDDFFIAVRYLYVARATQPEFNRLSFVLLGVATPGDLIKDATRTPFNIGKRVDLTDFTFEEALPLADGLGLVSQEAQKVLEWALEWTGGHPYLTQRLCGALAQELGNGKSAINQSLVEQIVNSTFLGVMSEQDNNLQFVGDMLTKRSPDPEVLTIYRQIRLGRGSVVDEEQSIAKSHLKLAGIVRTEKGVLQLRNRIYGQVFDRRWINQHLPFNLKDRWEQFKPALPYVAGLLSLIAILVIALVIIDKSNQELDKERLKEKMAADFARKQSQRAEVQKQLADQQRKRAEKGEQQAKSAQKLAEQRRIVANQQRQRAEQEEQQAKSAQTLAQQRGFALQSSLYQTKSAEQLAQQQKNVAEEQRFVAENQKKEAIKQRVNAEFTAQSYKSQNLLDANLQLEALVAGLQLGKQVKIDKNVTSDTKILAISTLQQVVYGVNERNRLEGHSDAVYSVAFSPDGKSLASASEDHTIKLWNLQGQLLHTFTGHTSFVSSVAFSPDSKSIASASWDHTVKLWNLQGQLLHTFTGHSDAVHSVAFSPDGKSIASASADKTVKLWNLQGQLLHTFTGHSSGVWSVAFSPDGKSIASASADNKIKLWNLQGQLLHTFTGHSSLVWSVAFSPDGKSIASASRDNTIKLWNLQGQLLHTFTDYSSDVYSVAFSPDGKSLASINPVKLWNLDLDDLLVKGCDWVSDYLQNNLSMKDSADRHVCDDIPRPK